jgi:hypothetical protein
MGQQQNRAVRVGNLMHKNKYVTAAIGFVSGAGLFGALIGCAHAQPGSPGPYSAPPQAGASMSFRFPGVEIRAESDFYEPLTPQGEWVTIGSYGRCWRPGHVTRDWRPYCNGYWQSTDAGWYWVSDEPWAWATYHYGRWDFTDQYGWYWVPQTIWAPAWVSWHQGGGYVGWAPLQPSVSISVSGYVGFNRSRIPPRAFVFVKQERFLDPVRSTSVIANNTTIINKTTVINNTRIVNNTVINEGPPTAVIEKTSGRKVQAVQVRELRQKEEAPVVARQKITVPPNAKKETNVQEPARRQVAPSENKTVSAPRPVPVEKPNLTPPAPAPLTPGRAKEIEKAKPAPAQAEPRVETARPSAIKETPAPKAAKHAEPTETPGKKSEKEAPPQSVAPAKEKPAASEKNGSNPGDKDHENKGKE